MQKQEAVITIASIGEKGTKFWIKDTNGEFYSGFTEYQGTPNTEYQQLKMGNHNEPFKEGDQALVVFTKSVGKDDKIYKNLKSIFPAGGRTPSQPEKPRYEAPMSSQRPSEGRNWDKEAYEK
jgi:hypothetical protein